MKTLEGKDSYIKQGLATVFEIFLRCDTKDDRQILILGRNFPDIKAMSLDNTINIRWHSRMRLDNEKTDDQGVLVCHMQN